MLLVFEQLTLDVPMLVPGVSALFRGQWVFLGSFDF